MRSSVLFTCIEQTEQALNGLRWEVGHVEGEVVAGAALARPKDQVADEGAAARQDHLEIYNKEN